MWVKVVYLRWVNLWVPGAPLTDYQVHRVSITQLAGMMGPITVNRFLEGLWESLLLEPPQKAANGSLAR